MALFSLLPFALRAAEGVPAAPPERIQVHSPNLAGQTARPLRYRPDGTDFVITNGAEFFNRPLYCANTGFRVDGGDRPEFSLYVPGRGGNLRVGIKTAAGAKWLNDADRIIARYRPGSLVYEIRDPLMGAREMRIAVLPLSGAKGAIVRVEMNSVGSSVELIWAFGGANGMRGSRGGDIGCEREPISEFFQLRAEQCRDNEFTLATNSFVLRSRIATIASVASRGAAHVLADANRWADPAALLASAGNPGPLPVAVGRIALDHDRPVFLALRQMSGNEQVADAEGLPELFSAAEQHRRAVAERVVVKTPDPFINAAAAAINVAGDAIWDEPQGAYMHGAVAWRSKLLGWRGPYTGDALGWHDRARTHLTYWAGRQNTNPVPSAIPPADPTANLSRNEPALHSNGALSASHYDMNLVYIDAVFRHLLWTGDLEFAKQQWPVIERHLAWERRLFRREFGPEKLPLYEAYAAIWASDDLDYHGGGSTHSSAYNYYHNKMAARLARIIGHDPAPYEREAELIAKAMRQLLWLSDRGWFAEWKDYLGLQLVHPNPGLWTIYHTIDSEVTTPLEAWQLTRFVDTQLARLPIHGPGVPEGDYFTVPTTSWMPYTWSLNNVVMAEVAHTSLAYWQAGRGDKAFNLFKSCLLDSMFMGLCPGNVGMTTDFDVARREAQRDFADAVGVCSRALVEGLFGVQPDLWADELRVRPGFPADWERAAMHHPDFDISFRREGLAETFSVAPRFPRAVALRLQIPAPRDGVASVTVNGRPVSWRALDESVGLPRIEIQAGPAAAYEVVITWNGHELTRAMAWPDSRPRTNAPGRARRIEFADPQKVLVQEPSRSNSAPPGLVIGKPADRTGFPREQAAFERLSQGGMTWWEPVAVRTVEAARAKEALPPKTWTEKLPATTTLNLIDLAPYFNDQVTRIFRNEYLSPRSPFCSLALPKQGIGSWCNFRETFEVDDSGLRSVAARNGGRFVLPNGVPLQITTNAEANNVLFTSQWDNFPRAATIPLSGKASRAFLLMAGSSNPMQSRFDNGEVIVTYADDSSERLALDNPVNWWPIDQDYFIDDFAFRRPEPIPPRVDLKTGRVRLLDPATCKGQGRKVPGGAANVLDLPLNPGKELKSLTVRTLANEVVIGLMAVTLER